MCSDSVPRDWNLGKELINEKGGWTLMRQIFITILFILLPTLKGGAQQMFDFEGQVSAWLSMSSGNTLPFGMGARYIPQGNLHLLSKGKYQMDLELSAYIIGDASFHPFDSLCGWSKIKPYRALARFETPQLELRLGLQKINFGSATLLRPLMWFDQMDPRDPLQLTDGVWGLLGRYFFLNNANIWLWGLYGNKGPKAWELDPVSPGTAEYGGRFQLPMSRGEAGISFHHRKTDPPFDKQNKLIPENRYGFDVKLDVEVGLWFEGAWINKHLSPEERTNQKILNLGMDYTFSLGNGLHFILEQLLFSYDNEPLTFRNDNHFTAAAFSYPLSIFDNISTIAYYDWTRSHCYSFVSWQRQFNHFAFYLMAFYNPDAVHLAIMQEKSQIFSGKGFQFMIVYNH